MEAQFDCLYKIAVCDDEPVFLEEIQKLVGEILDSHEIAYCIDCFSSKKALEDALKQDVEKYDLILLDILLGNQSGIDLAKKIRKMKVEATLIFVTVSADFAIEGYEVDAFRYLLKPISRKALEDALLLDYENHQEQRKKELVLAVGSKIRKIPHAEIRYIEIQGRATAIQMRKERLVTTYKISELENMLSGSSIVRCHRSFLVNLKYIHMLERYQAAVTTEDNIPISKAYYNDVKDAFMDYLSQKF
ncbi:MAG: LytTR family DNA-binding domain-containing protein [Anaerovorax sp.]|nr:LytTR family DNA-binding domain-containing protein [Anaerovorax sp.]